MVKKARMFFAYNHFQRKRSVILLFVLWLLGFVCGLYFISSSGDIFSSLITQSAHIRPSVIGLLAVVYIPVLISFSAIYFSLPVITYLFCIVKSFAFSCCLCSVAMAFGNAGWLVSLLLLFSESVIAVGMCLFWCRTLNFNRHKATKELFYFTIVFTAIGILDYFIVAPYLMLLMNYL